MKKTILIFLAVVVTIFLATQVAFPNALAVLGFSGASFFAGELWRVFTFSFVHTSMLHLVENLFSLFIVALLAYEFEFSVLELAIVFGATSLFVATITGILFPAILIVGASLGLYGVFGALAIKSKDYIKPWAFYLFFALIIGWNIVYNLSIGSTLEQPAYHTAGLIIGAILYKGKGWVPKPGNSAYKRRRNL